MSQLDEAAERIVKRFELAPHPEGGYFREIYRAAVQIEHPGIPARAEALRSSATHIYYLLPAEQISAFHRVKWSDEIWHLYGGGPLELHSIDDDGRHRVVTLATELEHGEQIGIVPAGRWQAVRLPPGAAWAFCGCTVTPGFDFADFEMPRAADLLTQFPQHASLIRALARP